MSNKKLRKEIEQLNAENERLRRMARGSSKKSVTSGNAKRQRKSKQKKKRGCFGGCLHAIKNLIVFCLVMLVIIGVGGYFVGDYYAKQHLDMSANEILNVLGGLTKSSESKLLNEDDKFNDTDLDNFYANLKDQLFLSSEFDLKGTLEELVADAVDSDNSSDVVTASDTTEESDPLAKLLKAENFNLARIKEFDYDNADEFMRYALTDRQLASFLNSVITSSFVTEMIDKQVKDSLGFDVPFRLSVKKIKFFEQVDQFNVYDDNGEFTGTSSGEVQKLQISIGYELRKTLEVLIEQYLGEYGDFSFLAKAFMEEFYLTLEIALTHDCAPRVYINNMDAVLMGNLYKLVKNATGLLGDEIDIEKQLADIGTNTLFPIFDSLNDTIPFNEITNRTLQFSPFDLLVGVLAKDFEGETPEGRDFFLLLQVLLESDWADVVYQPFRQVGYKPSSNPDAPDNGWEAVVLLTEEDMLQALDDGIIELDADGEYVFADHVELFKEVLEDRYYIEIEDFDELIKLITGSAIDDTDSSTTPLSTTDDNDTENDSISVLLDKFKKDKFREDYNNPDEDDDVINQPIYITDFILAGIMDEVFKRFDNSTDSENGEESGFDMSIIKLEQLIIFNQEASENLIERDFMLMTISIRIDDLIKSSLGESQYSTFITELIDDGQLPSQLFATLTVDITDTEERINPYLQLNEMGNDYKADKVWNLLKALVGVDMDDVASQVGDFVTPVIDQMRDMMPIEFKHNLTEQERDSGAIQLPGIMSFIIELMQLEIEDEVTGEMRLIEASELRRILMTLDKGSIIDEDDTAKGNYLDNLPNPQRDSLNEFFKLLEQKYYLVEGTLSYDTSIESALEWYCVTELNMTVPAEISSKIDELKNDTTVDKDAIYQAYVDAMSEKILQMDTLFDEIGSLFRLWQTDSGNTSNYYGLLDDNTPIEEMDVFLTDKQMVELIKTQIDADLLQGTEIMQIKVSFDGENYVLEMTVRAQLSDLFGEDLDFSKFLPENALSVAYIRAFVTIADNKTSINGKGWYETEVVLNDVDDADMNLLMNFIGSYTDSDMLGDFKVMLGESIHDAFASLQDTLGFEFAIDEHGNGGLKFKHFYDVLSEILGMEEAQFFFDKTDELSASEDSISDSAELFDKYQNIWAMFVAEYGGNQGVEDTEDSFILFYEEFREYMTLHFYDVMRLSLQGMHVSNEFVERLVVSKIESDDEQTIENFLGTEGFEAPTGDTPGRVTKGDGDNVDIQIKVTLGQPSPFDYELEKLSLSDYAFARFIKNNMDAMTSDEDKVSDKMNVEIEQIMILANTDIAAGFNEADPGANSKIDNYMFNFYNDFILGRTDSLEHTYTAGDLRAHDFLVFTVKAVFDDSLKFEGAGDILPSEIYISLIRNNTTSATMVVINGYTPEEQEMFFDLIVTASGDQAFSERKLLDIMEGNVIGAYLGNADFEKNNSWGEDGDQVMGRITYGNFVDLSPALLSALGLDTYVQDSQD